MKRTVYIDNTRDMYQVWRYKGNGQADIICSGPLEHCKARLESRHDYILRPPRVELIGGRYPVMGLRKNVRCVSWFALEDTNEL